CIRLYSEDDYDARPEFTDPEILRTNLASVILQMTALGLGDLAAFPFLDPPDRRNINDGVQLLQELGALDPEQQDEHKRLTDVGKRLARLPIDPRLARMVLEADKNGSLRDVLVIAAALSVQDPRERPTDSEAAATQQHARFADPNSDFVSYLNLWQYLGEQRKALSSNQFRKLCRSEFLNYLRVREWLDLHGQLRQITRGLGMTPSDNPADPAQVHQALLAGMLSHIGLKDGSRNEYQGARNARFAVFPGSALFRKPPSWVMAAELVETSRLWGRIAARIEPEWVERLAGHLVKRTYSEPHWARSRGAVMATERVTLYGVPLVTGRQVNYGRMDPELCRDLFIRNALVEGDWQTHHKFFHHNRALLGEVAELENRARRRDILVDDETLFAFYDQRIGPDVVSARHFDAWWKQVRRDKPDLLTFDKDMLVNESAGEVSETEYPNAWRSDGAPLPLTYQFEPGTSTDGVTVDLPLPVLSQVSDDQFGWHVPGLRAELVTALIKSLPKQLRRNFVPAPDVAKAVLAELPERDEPLLVALSRELRRLTGVTVPLDAWQPDQIPDHLKINFRVVDEQRKTVAQGRDLAELQRTLRPKTQTVLAEAAKDITRTGLTDWTFGPLPRSYHQHVAGFDVTGYPALVDAGSSVAIKVFDSEAEQRHAMWLGTRRLLLLTVPSPVRSVIRGLDNRSKLALGTHPYASLGDLLDDCVSAAADHLMAEHGGPAWDVGGFTALRTAVRAGLGATTFDVIDLVRQVLTVQQEVGSRLADMPSFTPSASLADVRAQLGRLVYSGFVAETGLAHLADVVRYLRAVDRRLEKLPENPKRDVQRTEEIAAITEEYRELVAGLPAGLADTEPVRRLRWMIEELRVSYFAQTLRTAYPVSEKRIRKALDEVLG
ncbi:MAG TPA: ATP-dependent RNA helicase HrpA, partial [Pseudonocardiaceae bacterium]|nr:ATP-dependent RNA helicase HrpA [Pseudonocardiaceae bacterium]